MSTTPTWRIVAVLAFTGSCAAFMQTLMIPIQSELPQILGEPPDRTAWVVTASLLSAAVLTPVSGRLGDIYGKRRVMIGLLCVLALGSVVALLSNGLGALVVGRALQGTAIGAIPLGISIARDVVPDDRLPGAVALISATLGVGGSLGLPVSATISAHAHWHLLFVLATGLAMLLLVLVIRVVPPIPGQAVRRFDYVGAVGLAAGLTAVLLAVSQGNRWGWASPATIATGLGGCVLLLAWGTYELRCPAPVVDLRVSARRAVLFTNLASVAIGFALFAGTIAFPQRLELPEWTGVGIGLSLVEASLVLMPAGLVMMVLSPVSARLCRVVGPRLVLALGAGITGIAYLFALLLAPSAPTVAVVNALVGAGIGIAYAAMPTLIMRSVPESETAAANGVNAFMRSFGTSVSAAVVGAILAALTEAAGGGAFPSEAAFMLSALCGLGGAVLAVVLSMCIPHGRRTLGLA